MISECNRANVAVYPIDVRGLTSGVTAGPGSAHLETIPDFGTARLVTATLDYSEGDQPAKLVYVQRGGTGGGGVGWRWQVAAAVAAGQEEALVAGAGTGGGGTRGGGRETGGGTGSGAGGTRGGVEAASP